MAWRILPHLSETSNDGWSDEGTPKGRLSPITLSLALIRPHLGTFTLGLMALSLGSAITVGLPEIGRRVLESSSRSTILVDPVPVAITLASVFGILALCVYVRTMAFGKVAVRIVREVRTAYFKSAILDFARIQADGSSISASRIDSEAASLHEGIASKLPLFVRYGVQTLASLGFMILLSPVLSLVAALSVLFLVATAYAFSERIRRSAIDEQSYKVGIVGWTREVLEGVLTVRSFHAHEFVESRFLRRLEKLFGKSIRRLKVGAISSAILVFVNSASIVIGVSFGISLVASGGLTWSELATFSIYATILTISCALCISGFVELLQCMSAAEKLVERARVPAPGFVDSNMQVAKPSSGIKVVCEGLTFQYGEISADEPVINNVNFTLEPGSTSAIMGPSGAGKSTIVRLLLGFESISSGRITLNDIDVAEISQRQFREMVAWVPLDPTLLSVSIAENLRLANPEATDDELMIALDRVGLGRLIRQCPEGLQTEIGERGGGLSSGQRQRLALARVLLRQPSLVVLDEATAALDVESETKVQAALRAALPNATFLIISHRTSSVRMADQIFVLDGGRILRRTTFPELLAERLPEPQLLAAAI